MHKMTRHYLIAALWSSIAPESLEQAEQDCLSFLRVNEIDVAGDYKQAGHDFWLTRNHHGAGFWDGGWGKERGERLTAASHAYRELCPVVGDDGLIYFE